MKKIISTVSIAIYIAFLLPLTALAADLTDISNHKNQTAIQYLYESGVIGGYQDSTFKPNNTVNRAELLKILVGGKGITPTLEEHKNCFPDVKEEWFAPYVCYAASEGWVDGYPDGTFRPAKEVNKAEALKMLVNSQEYSHERIRGKIYDDVATSDWFAPYINTAKAKGLLEESSGNFSPGNPMKRGGISENIYRVMIVKENQLSSFNEFSNVQEEVSSTYYTVTNVVDGDTIDVEQNGEELRLRLIGVDTPETVHPSKPVECFGAEASNITRQTLLNQQVTLELDPTQGDMDRYNRALRYVILEDGTNFNKWLIENGYAFEYTYNIPYKYQSEFQAAELTAEIRKNGLWADGVCADFKENVVEDAVEVTPVQTTSYKFYVSSRARSKYYCETDPAWQELSRSNLREYDSEEALRADYPNLELNQPCE